MSNNVAVRLKLASRAAIGAPLGFVSVSAGWAGLGRVMLILERYGDPFRFCFVRCESTNFAVIPTTDFLIGLFPQINPISDVLDVTHDNGCRATGKRFIDDGAANLVFNVAGNALVLGFHAAFGPDQLLIAAASFVLAGNSLIDFSQPLGMALLFMATLTASNDRGAVFITNDGGVNLAKVYADHVVTQRCFGLFAILNNDMPSVAAGLLIENKPRFLHFQDAMQMDGQSNFNAILPLPIRQPYNTVDQLDRRVLPDGCPKLLATPRKVSIDPSLAQRPSRFASLKEALLGRVNRMGVHGRVLNRRANIAQARKRLLFEPQPFLLEQSPVAANDPAVNPTTGEIETIGGLSVKMTGKNVRSDHFSSCSTFANLRTAISTISAWDTPSFSASSLMSAIASGVKRKLVAVLFAMQGLYRIARYMSSLTAFNSAKA